eukprot:10985331-Alexandrium_andersonii.AAC.1
MSDSAIEAREAIAIRLGPYVEMPARLVPPGGDGGIGSEPDAFTDGTFVATPWPGLGLAAVAVVWPGGASQKMGSAFASAHLQQGSEARGLAQWQILGGPGQSIMRAEALALGSALAQGVPVHVAVDNLGVVDRVQAWVAGGLSSFGKSTSMRDAD